MRMFFVPAMVAFLFAMLFGCLATPSSSAQPPVEQQTKDASPYVRGLANDHPAGFPNLLMASYIGQHSDKLTYELTFGEKVGPFAGDPAATAVMGILKPMMPLEGVSSTSPAGEKKLKVVYTLKPGKDPKAILKWIRLADFGKRTAVYDVAIQGVTTDEVTRAVGLELGKLDAKERGIADIVRHPTILLRSEVERTQEGFRVRLNYEGVK